VVNSAFVLEGISGEIYLGLFLLGGLEWFSSYRVFRAQADWTFILPSELACTVNTVYIRYAAKNTTTVGRIKKMFSVLVSPLTVIGKY
jgi:hypothetical protein